jgi:tetratricopeptide (TPR) repeat protein
MQTGFLITIVLVMALLAASPSSAGSGAELTEVSSLLMRARYSHEPRTVIQQAVVLLDQMLDNEPENRIVWLRLGEALAIGHARSKHAASAADAWRRAYLLDTSDCHAGALAVRSAETSFEESWLQELARNNPQCPETSYLLALRAKEGSEARSNLLRNSIAVRSSSDALVAIAQELVRAGNSTDARKRYSAALSADPLFAEDWRPDGATAVHVHLGLAWIYYARGQLKSARTEYRKFLGWFNEPGPWHYLSEMEERWHATLDDNIFVTPSSSGHNRRGR